jgi:hypothetical protein
VVEEVVAGGLGAEWNGANKQGLCLVTNKILNMKGTTKELTGSAWSCCGWWGDGRCGWWGDGRCGWWSSWGLEVDSLEKRISEARYKI